MTDSATVHYNLQKKCLTHHNLYYKCIHVKNEQHIQSFKKSSGAEIVILKIKVKILHIICNMVREK